MNRYLILISLTLFFGCSKKEKAIEKARDCLGKRYYQLAISYLKPYEGDKDPKVQWLLGNALLGEDKFEEASYRYGLAIKIDPSYKESVAVSYARRGEELKRVGSYDQAITLYKKAISYSFDNPEYPVRLGDLYLRTERFGLASLSYERAIEITKDSLFLKKIYENLIKSYIGAGDLSKASNLSLQALNKGFHTLSYIAGEIFYKYGLSLFKKGRLDSALVLLQRVIDLNAPVRLIDDAEFLKGEIWFRKGEYKKAERSYSQVLRLNPFFQDSTRAKAEKRLSLIKRLK